MDWSKIRHFKESEFTCKCGCGACDMNHQFVAALDLAREKSGVPFQVASGFRCAEHNAKCGGVADSAHTRGYAADIITRGSQHRMLVMRALLQFFDRVGVYQTFIHVDVDPDKPAGVMWVGR